MFFSAFGDACAQDYRRISVISLLRRAKGRNMGRVFTSFIRLLIVWSTSQRAPAVAWVKEAVSVRHRVEHTRTYSRFFFFSSFKYILKAV